ncbi:short-chain dehydrogenases/reductase [Penicillium capsulatum]|uniref:Short-chain dehydrogenases/reductase n=1 Tax=Penicillium capsulatum TaxID=69766 RepID=A0A9W9HR10_9EURO|nr:short-chain dehydrogenases/reductase [Penicillium capsulatum]KAJ6112825.1 short-chain dehydrogenases/reductase [Penicillium capsulatum]
MAYLLAQIRDWNSSLKSSRSDFVALFVGGTSGIGKHTALKLTSFVSKPSIYIIGRNEAAGAQVMEELKAANPNGTYAFIPADTSDLRNVDAACQDIKKRVNTLDLLFLSTGTLAMGRHEGRAGIDVNHMLRYYSRMRFVQNLMPLLESGKSSRVVSVLGGGKEVDVEEDNLDLNKSFSFMKSTGYPGTMTSMAFENLASKHPSVSFLHVFPGVVATPLVKTSMGGGILGTVMSAMMKPFAIAPEESGEWHTFLSTSPDFPAKAASQDLPADSKANIARASTGEKGGGSYILNHNGQNATNEPLMSQFRERGLADTIWKHTLGVFDQASA